MTTDHPKYISSGCVVRSVPVIPEEFHDLFEKATFAHLTTVLPNGNLHSIPVWIDYDADEDRRLVNSERGRRKTRNAAQNSTASISMTDPDDPYRFLSLAGEIEAITAEGAREHIDRMARRYLGEEEYPYPIESERVLLRIRPTEVFTR
jgi:PPOX class probable F420-dependent enzyme